MTTWKTMTIQTFVSKMLGFSFFIQGASISILWLQSPSTVILELEKMKSNTVSTFPPFICHEVMGQHAMIFIFRILNFKPSFSLSSFINKFFSSSSLSAIKVKPSAYLRCRYAPYSHILIFSYGSQKYLDISPSNLDSSLWVIQPSISCDVLCV